MKSALLCTCLALVAGCHAPQAPAAPCQTFNSDGTFSLPPPTPTDMATDMNYTQALTGCFYATQQVATRTACAPGITQHCDPSGAGAPNVACVPPVTARPDMATSGPQVTQYTVTLQGYLKVLANGPDTDQVGLSTFEEVQLSSGIDPAQQVPIGTQQVTLNDMGLDRVSDAGVVTWKQPTPRKACDADPSVGCSVPILDNCGQACNDGLHGRPDDHKYCFNDGKGGSCRDRQRWEAKYTIIATPVGIPLVVRTSGSNNRPDKRWASLYQWNVEVPATPRPCRDDNDDACLDCGDGTIDCLLNENDPDGGAVTPIYRLDLTVLSQADWSLLAMQASLMGGIPFNRAIVFGSLRDCDGVAIGGAEVALTSPPARMSYYDADPTVNAPDPRRHTTDPLGRFVGFDVAPGPLTVSGAGALATGDPLSFLGDYSIVTYTNSASLVNLGPVQ